MFSPDHIEALRIASGRLTDPVVEFLLKDIARRVREAGSMTSTAAYQAWRAEWMGMGRAQMEKELARLLEISRQEARQLVRAALQYGYDTTLSKRKGHFIPFEENASLQQITQTAMAMAGDGFKNLTQTKAIFLMDPRKNYVPLPDAYLRCTDFAFQQVITGAADYNTAIRGACAGIAKHGVTVAYESGVRTSLEAAVRRNIMGGLGLAVEQVQQMNHDELGCDGWEISAHANSAPDHEPIQGKQYPDKEYEALNNSLVRRIGTLNCGHVASHIILGVDSPQYTPEELEKFREDNERGVDFNGQHYTGYEATQRQRQIERAIRAQKRRTLLAAPEDAETASIRLERLNQEYRRFSHGVGLRTEDERLRVVGFGWKKYRKVKSAVAVAQKHATMDTKQPMSGESAVHYVTRIDIDKYRCVSENITTDEVVITDERIRHIKDHHPNDFERYEQYLARIVEEPDYILESDLPHTAFLLKEIIDADERFQLILRLKVTGDPEGYKNSAITFLKISEKKWKKYLRNKNVLYKRE